MVAAAFNILTTSGTPSRGERQMDSARRSLGGGQSPDHPQRSESLPADTSVTPVPRHANYM
jgi:hypothetical protein